VGRGNCHLGELLVFHFVNDVLHFLLGWVVTHSAHEERQLINGDLLVFKFACLCCVLLFGTDYTVVEEVIHILESLTLATTFNQVDERFDTFATHSNCLLNGCNTYLPHVDCQIFTTASENPLAIVGTADVGDFVGVSDQTHCLVGVAVHWQLNQTNHFLVCAVAQVLVVFSHIK